MTHLHVTWIVQYDKAHSHVYSCTGSKGKHGVLVRNSWVWVMSRIRMCHVTYINEWCHVWMCHVTYQCGMSHTWMNSYTRLKSKHGALVRNSCLPACSHCSSTTANRLPLPPVFYHNRAFWMNLGLFCSRQGSFEWWQGSFAFPLHSYLPACSHCALKSANCLPPPPVAYHNTALLLKCRALLSQYRALLLFFYTAACPLAVTAFWHARIAFTRLRWRMRIELFC